MDISVIIVNWNTKSLLLDCLSSIFDTMRDLEFEVWLVDNGSSDGSVEAVREAFPTVGIIANEKNRGFGAANNQAFEKMNGRYALLVNTDCVLTRNTAPALLDYMDENPEVGLACGQLLNRDGSKQNSFAGLPDLASLILGESVLRMIRPSQHPGKNKEYNHPLEVGSCIGALMMIRKTTLDEVGFFDEDFFFFFEETDMAYRFRRSGWKIMFVPWVRTYHLQGQSVGHGLGSRLLFLESRRIYYTKTLGVNPHLFNAATFIRLTSNLLFSLFEVGIALGLSPRRLDRFKTRLRLWRHHVGWDNPPE